MCASKVLSVSRSSITYEKKKKKSTLIGQRGDRADWSPVRTQTVPDCHHPALSARLPAVRASQMARSVIMAAIGGSLLLISTPTEHNVHNNVCSVSGCTTPTVGRQTPLLQTWKWSTNTAQFNYNSQYLQSKHILIWDKFNMLIVK